MSGPFITVGICNALLFAVYGSVLRNFNKDKPDPNITPTVVQACLAGSISGFCISWLICPIELVKTKLQVQTDSSKAKMYKGPMDMTIKLARKFGPRVLFTGMTSTLMREIP
eukprot:Pgem_evm1s12780